MVTGKIGRNQIGRNQKRVAYTTGKVTSVFSTDITFKPIVFYPKP